MSAASQKLKTRDLIVSTRPFLEKAMKCTAHGGRRTNPVWHGWPFFAFPVFHISVVRTKQSIKIGDPRVLYLYALTAFEVCAIPSVTDGDDGLRFY